MHKYLIAAACGLSAAVVFAGLDHAQARTKVAVIEASSIAVKPGSTWAWVIATSSADPRIANDIMQERLQTAVETNLAAKGLRQVPSPGAAQFLVAYHVRLENRVEPRISGGSGGACGFRGCGRGAGPSLDVKRYTEGTLVLDILDARTGRLVYRAASEKKVTEKDASQAKLNKMVAEMTKSLPSA